MVSLASSNQLFFSPPISIEEERVNAERKDLIRGIGRLYAEIISSQSTSATLSPFSSKHLPSVSINQYISRIGRFSQCSNEALVMAVIYIDRIEMKETPFKINAQTIHRLFLASIRIANKFHDDTIYGNRYFAEVGGIDNQELNLLEAQFFFNIDFKLSVEESEYKECKRQLLERGTLARNQGIPQSACRGRIEKSTVA